MTASEKRARAPSMDRMDRVDRVDRVEYIDHMDQDSPQSSPTSSNNNHNNNNRPSRDNRRSSTSTSQTTRATPAAVTTASASAGTPTAAGAIQTGDSSSTASTTPNAQHPSGPHPGSAASKRRRGLGVVTPNACTECRKKRAKVRRPSSPSPFLHPASSWSSKPMFCVFHIGADYSRVVSPVSPVALFV